MSAVLLVVVLAVAAAICVGIYFTLRGFRELDHPHVDVKPRYAKHNPHDPAMTAQLKHFFEGKQCAVCTRPIPPVHAGGMRPGLLNPNTHEATPWDAIPAANLSATLERHAAICSNCLVLERFRKEHPDLVVDRHRTIENASH